MDIPNFKFALREDLLDSPNFIPVQGEPFSTGWDCSAAPADRKPIVIRPGTYFAIPLGIRMFAPEGWWMQLNPRSSSFVKKHIHSLYGVIDNHFENELKFCGTYLPDPRDLGKDLVINFGDRIGQLIPIQRQQMIVECISNEEYDKQAAERGGIRGIGGFGSTGG